MQKSRWLGIAMVMVLLVGSTGCEALKQKFIRKRKVEQKVEPIFTLEQQYRPEHLPEIRYQAHFAYWKAAHDDLIEDLDEATRARRLRAIRQAIKELKAMQALLEGPPAERLGRLIEEMTRLEARLADPAFNPQRAAILRSTVESLRRRIDKGYDYHKVKAALRPDMPVKSD